MDAPNWQNAVARIQAEFTEMPDLRLTRWQVERLCDLPQELCEAALAALVRSGILSETREGMFGGVAADAAGAWSAFRSRHAVARDGLIDEDVASQCDVPVLVTAQTERASETIARRIHDRSRRVHLPFVPIPSGTLPVDRTQLSAAFGQLLRLAHGGTLFFASIERTPTPVQGFLFDLVQQIWDPPQLHRSPRVIAGTTATLADAIESGLFSAGLFYRLSTLQVFDRREASRRDACAPEDAR